MKSLPVLGQVEKTKKNAAVFHKAELICFGGLSFFLRLCPSNFGVDRFFCYMMVTVAFTKVFKLAKKKVENSVGSLNCFCSIRDLWKLNWKPLAEIVVIS